MTKVTLDIISGIVLRMKDYPDLDWSKIAANAFVEAMDQAEAGINPREKHIAWLQAQIAQMDSMLSKRSPINDPIGYNQYMHRKAEFQRELELVLEKDKSNDNM